jgi:PHD/YefM family antitoxin component YafN of YafNO toxin-antitoxin module
MPLSEVQALLPELCRNIAALRQRVEITLPETGEACVLLSKAELDCLERALEVLGDSDAVREVSAQLAHLAAAAQYASA